MKAESSSVLYQKIGVVIDHLPLSLLSKRVGDRILPIAGYQQEYGVSRGTIQNAFNHLKEVGAIELTSHGHMGTYIKAIDYKKLQENCLRKELLGIMPLPYSLAYEGFATAIYQQLKRFKFNMAYARGAEGRIRLVDSGIYQFAICSQYAAECLMARGMDVEAAINFGSGSFLSQHVLLLRDENQQQICDGMRVAYDAGSLDQSGITQALVRGRQVELVDIRTQETLAALADGVIDAGVWNYDDIVEKPQLQSFHVVFLDEQTYDSRFAAAVMVIRKGNRSLQEFLTKNISKETTLQIINEVKNRERRPYF